VPVPAGDKALQLAQLRAEAQAANLVCGRRRSRVMKACHLVSRALLWAAMKEGPLW
jgi:hypothetical protein